MRSVQNQQTPMTGSCLVTASSWRNMGWGWGEVTAKGYESGACHLGDEGGLKLFVVMVVQCHEDRKRKD